MVVDIHTHVAYHKVYPPRFLDLMVGDLTHAVSRANSTITRAKTEGLIRGFLSDSDGRIMIRQMDRAGIDKAVLLIIDGGICLGESEFSLEEIFDHHYKLLRRYPDRLKVFGGVDPSRGGKGFELFLKGFEKFGFEGLKLYPSMGYAMDDEKLIPYYEHCDRFGLPVLLHTGPSLDVLQNELANPECIENVAPKFPNVNFILAHAGQRITEPFMTTIIKLPNVYLDVSAFQMGYKDVSEKMICEMGPIFKEGIFRKILFGSDYPLFNLFIPLKSNIELLRSLAQSVNEKADGALEGIMGKNAQALFDASKSKHR